MEIDPAGEHLATISYLHALPPRIWGVSFLCGARHAQHPDTQPDLWGGRHCSLTPMRIGCAPSATALAMTESVVHYAFELFHSLNDETWGQWIAYLRACRRWTTSFRKDAWLMGRLMMAAGCFHPWRLSALTIPAAPAGPSCVSVATANTVKHLQRVPWGELNEHPSASRQEGQRLT